jgi:hypothetical protein
MRSPSRDKSRMELGCDRCRAFGSSANPTFFSYERFALPDRHVPPKDRCIFKVFDVPLLFPLEATTRDKKSELANAFGIQAPDLSVVCAGCIASGDQEKLRTLQDRWADSLAERSDGGYQELVDHLTPRDQHRLSEARRQAMEELGVELQIQGRAEYVVNGTTLPRIESERGRPARPALKKYAAELLRALEIKYKGTTPPPRVERLRLLVGRLLLRSLAELTSRVKLFGSARTDEKLIDQVRELLR